MPPARHPGRRRSSARYRGSLWAYARRVLVLEGGPRWGRHSLSSPLSSSAARLDGRRRQIDFVPGRVRHLGVRATFFPARAGREPGEPYPEVTPFHPLIDDDAVRGRRADRDRAACNHRTEVVYLVAREVLVIGAADYLDDLAVPAAAVLEEPAGPGYQGALRREDVAVHSPIPIAAAHPPL